ncbi:hypothetical protein LUZ63_016965 [Rhynchospora breviuscula]|uniref:F-box domain-containing protein n=1 Tax=Rhynchospora breviuscula TaxID=2022672 RepID=A0A9Q0HG77_9POAL|nr:hypothetical protein LUZ63_016965 [Rhynchospora breviuscula]
MPYFPQEVVECILSYLTSHQDRNSVSLVCKDWSVVEQKTRRHVYVSNCYAVSPTRVATRFSGLRVLTVKGMPHFADFGTVPHGWGGSVWPWIRVMTCCCPRLEEIRFKRMVVSDESLMLISRSFPNLKSLVLVSCQEFSTDGLAEIASSCRQLRELDLQENEVNDHGSHWLECFPNSFTSLETLKFTCLRSAVNSATLEGLVARCPNLRTLHVNSSVSVECLSRFLVRAPQLVDLGTGSLSSNQMGWYRRLFYSFQKCKGLKSLSGIWFVGPRKFQPVVYPVCGNLLSLKLSSAPWILKSDLIDVIRNCPRLQKLWVVDRLGDEGLAVVGSTCQDLRELRVFQSNFHAPSCWVTEEGLIAISTGCPKLNSLLYFCAQMTNAALMTVAKNCSDLIRFKLRILDPVKPDPVTNHPLDEGFGAIVQGCKGLKRLSLSGFLTDQVFLYIGMYAERLEMLSIAYAGETDNGMMYVLNGCKNLRKLKIQDCPFGDKALLEDFTKYETLRSLWMSSCDVTIGGCKALAAKNTKLSVEVISDLNSISGLSLEPRINQRAEKVYIYRTVAGPRTDAPTNVSIL